MNSREVIKKIHKNGWKLDRVTGSHHIFIQEGKGTIVTVPHPKKDIPIGTIKSIEKQSGIKLLKGE
ncbi:MAG TPA: addiction module toxin, HicA family [Clostridiales bacterium]|nr:MAG: addiction module toxin, HicA family [Clostridiales bacterium GWD2_32_59]HAN10646.1 addiction module toxin, HicA family [Clostridiales bacterium]